MEAMQSGMATPPPNTPKTRKTSVDESKLNSLSSDNTQKHSIKFSMTKESFWVTCTRSCKPWPTNQQITISRIPRTRPLFAVSTCDCAWRHGRSNKETGMEISIPGFGYSDDVNIASYNTRTNYKKYLYLYELEHCDFPDKIDQKMRRRGIRLVNS